MANRARCRLVGLKLNSCMTEIFKHDKHLSAALRRHKESSRKLKQMSRAEQLKKPKKDYNDSDRKA